MPDAKPGCKGESGILPMHARRSRPFADNPMVLSLVDRYGSVSRSHPLAIPGSGTDDLCNCRRGSLPNRSYQR